MNNDKVKAAIAENPVLVLFLGVCPALGASADVLGALGMAGAVIIVMLLSTLLISLLRSVIPGQVRIPAYILITAGVTSLVSLMMNALLPSIYNMLGVYLAVVAVDLMVFGGAEAAGEKSLGDSLKSSLLTALGFALAVLILAALREILGSGSFAGIDLPFFSTYNIPILTKASGGFMVFAIELAVISALRPGATKAPAGFAGAAALLCDADNGTKGE